MSDWSDDTLRTIADSFRKPVGEADDPKERTRVRIVNAATEAFTRYGFRRASVDEIARAAGVGKGTIYLYYASKRDLFLAAVAEEKRALLPEMAAIQLLPPPARLEATLRMSFRFVLRAPLAASLLRREHAVTELLDDVGEELWQAQAAMGRQFLASLFDPDGDWPEEERAAIASTLNVMSMLLPHLDEERALGGVSLEKFTDTLAGLLARGAVAPSAR
jgi:AcrR family transcriptional regulator